METDKMNGWTKKRKVDTFMGIFLQVYCFFPWMRINRKWNTIHMYVIKTFQENDYIKMYNHTFLLDNALEACEQIKEGERWIHIKMKKKNQLLYIEIVNAAKNTGIQTDENFVSKKKDGVLHGYGMKNIRDIVEQYNGMFQCKSQEDRFEVVITIYG